MTVSQPADRPEPAGGDSPGRRRTADPIALGRLKARLRQLDGADLRRRSAVPLGVPAIDRALPGGGLAGAALHEILAADGDPAADGFVAVCLARLAAVRSRPVLWVAGTPGPYPPGLAAFGLDPARLILVAAPRPAERLWVMEQAVRAAGDGSVLAAVAGAVDGIDAVASRRLHLAAEAGGVPLLVRRAGRSAAGAGSVAVTRWQVASLPGIPLCLDDGRAEPGVPPARWRLDLLRCRGGRPAGWIVDWAGRGIGLVAADPFETDMGGLEQCRPSLSPALTSRAKVPVCGAGVAQW